MKKKFVVPILTITLLLTLACSIGYEGLQISDDPEPLSPLDVLINQETVQAVDAEQAGSAPAGATPEPEYQSVIPAGSDMERVVAGSHEYSINATNFDCTCQATANMTVDFNFTGSQVEITNGGGGATMVYDKIDDNKYQRSFMGYYILMSGEGDQATETKVEEENRTVIILTGNGYVMESYKGPVASPCCYYTFTIEK
jgi:hypothetical protein